MRMMHEPDINLEYMRTFIEAEYGVMGRHRG